MSNRTLMQADRSFRTRRVTCKIDEDVPVLNVSHFPEGCYCGFSIEQIRIWINALIEQRIADDEPWPSRVGFDLSDADIEDDWESVLAMRPTATAVEEFEDGTFEEHDWMATLASYSSVGMVVVYDILEVSP